MFYTFDTKLFPCLRTNSRYIDLPLLKEMELQMGFRDVVFQTQQVNFIPHFKKPLAEVNASVKPHFLKLVAECLLSVEYFYPPTYSFSCQLNFLEIVRLS